jgi:hypothetical integral membrane protein (TIGR02206 family)
VSAPFLRFGPDHLVALAAIALFALLTILVARRAPESASRYMRLCLAALMVGGSLAEITVSLHSGAETLEQVMPLELCDLSLLLGAFTLATLNRFTVEPLYFFSLAGTVPALLTPELPSASPTDLRFLAYFGLHGLTVTATLVLILGFGVRPSRSGWWRALLWLNLVAAVVGLVDVLAGANYMYLRAKPTVATVFDHLGPWPWYLVSLEGVAAGAFFVLGLPFWASRR